MGLGQVATNYNAKWFFGVNTGLTWQTTDVSNKFKTGWGLTLGKSFNYNTASFVSFDVRGRFLRGFWYGQDKEASTFIETIERRQGLKVACIEEIAFEKGYINKEELIELAQPLAKNQYGQYLLRRAEEVN